jgi:hypothetical protein
LHEQFLDHERIWVGEMLEQGLSMRLKLLLVDQTLRGDLVSDQASADG